MKILNRYKIVAILFLSALFTMSIFAFPAQAAEKQKYRIQISPVSQRLELKPGQKYTGTFKVQNVGTEKFEYKLSVKPYQVLNEQYDVDYSSRNNYTQIADWVTFDEDTGVLNPATDNTYNDSTAEITYTVNVPDDVPAGGQYAVITAETAGDDNSGPVQYVSQVGMVLYARVEGDTRQEGHIINNNINKFFFNPPIFATSLVENTGNVDFTTRYTVKVWPLFSNSLAFTNEDQPQESVVLPETKRFNSVKWENSPHLGIFTVEQTVEIVGLKNAKSVEKKLVIICPIWLIIIVVALIITMIYWLIHRAKQRKLNHKSVNE